MKMSAAAFKEDGKTSLKSALQQFPTPVESTIMFDGSPSQSPQYTLPSELPREGGKWDSTNSDSEVSISTEAPSPDGHAQDSPIFVNPGHALMVEVLQKKEALHGGLLPLAPQLPVPARIFGMGAIGPPPGLEPSLLTTNPSVAEPAASPKSVNTPVPVSAKGSSIHKRINQEIIAAANAPKAEIRGKVLELVEEKLDQMNCVNLSTAIHRLARACEGANQSSVKTRRHPVLLSMLDKAEQLAERELLTQEGAMPANCCTIITWSCASLRLFRTSLFSVLVKVACRCLAQCQAYELTNMLWALAELCRRHPDMGRELTGVMQEFLQSAAQSVLQRRMGDWKPQVLISALMSLTLLPPLKGLSQKTLILSIAVEIAARHTELAEENATPVLVAFNSMRKNHPQVFQEIVLATRHQCPDFAARYTADLDKANFTKSARSRKPAKK